MSNGREAAVIDTFLTPTDTLGTDLSSERSQLLEAFAVDIDAGPCVDCIRTGEPVVVHDVDDDAASTTASRPRRLSRCCAITPATTTRA